LYSGEKDEHNLGLFCLFSLSLYTLEIDHLRELDAISLLIKKLESGKYEKRVYALKIIINFMEISNLDEDLLKERNFELFDFLLHFTQSDIPEEQRLATRGLSKLSLQILRDKNPRIMPSLEDNHQFKGIESKDIENEEEKDRHIIKEDSSEASMSEKSSDKSKSSISNDDDFERQDEPKNESGMSTKFYVF